MKIKFDWREANKKVAKESKRRTKNAAEIMAGMVRMRCPVGTVSRPMYQSGPHAGQNWTSRDAGRLKESVRVTEKYGDEHSYLSSLVAGSAVYGTRVYAGHYLAWYGKIVEFYTPFFRPAIEESKQEVRWELENG